MKTMKVMTHSRVLLAVLGALSLSACAHSAGSYEPLQALKQGMTLSPYENLVLSATNDSSVPMTAPDRERLVNKIVRRVQVTGKYKSVNDNSPQPNTLAATLVVTNYDEGNAFLRFLLAGLGQIHIDGTLMLENSARESLTTYVVNKTFAWGGIYGGTTTIEAVEEGFAEAVAEILLEKNKQQE
jgi:hypothetical protein